MALSSGRNIFEQTIIMAFANDAQKPLIGLNKEYKGLKKILESYILEGKVFLKDIPFATPSDLLDIEYGNFNEISIFHFGGHAGGDFLRFETHNGNTIDISSTDLAELFGRLQGLKLVLLNGCSTLEQVNGFLSSGVKAVIATNRQVNDDIAARFSERFYKALTEGLNLDSAFNKAIVDTKLSYPELNKAGTDPNKSLQYRAKAPKFPWELHKNKGEENVGELIFFKKETLQEEFNRNEVGFFFRDTTINDTQTGKLYSKSEFDNIFSKERKLLISLSTGFVEKFSPFGGEKEGIDDLVELFASCNQEDLLEFFIDSFELMNIEDVIDSIEEIVDTLLLNWKINPTHTHFINLVESNTSVQKKLPEKRIDLVLIEKIQESLINLSLNKRHLLQKLFPTRKGQKWRDDFNLIRFGKSSNTIKENQTAIFCTPFIYSADKLISRVKSYQKKLSERCLEKVNIKLISLGCMNEDKIKLEELGIDFYVVKWLPKALSDKNEVYEISEMKKGLRRITGERIDLTRRNARSPFGYNDSEALFAIKEFGPPENVFPIFWVNDKNKRTVFNSFF